MNNEDDKHRQKPDSIDHKERPSENEILFRQLAENIQEVFFVRNLSQSQMIYVSPAYEKLWGQSRESLYKDPKAFLGAVHPADQALVQAALERQNQGGEFFNEEYRIVRPDGTVRWIWARTFPVHDEAGEIYRVAGLVEDITERVLAGQALRQAHAELEQRVKERTAELEAINATLKCEINERKRTQEALRESEETTRSLLNAYPDVALLIDTEGMILALNSAAENMLGRLSDQLIGVNIYDLFAPEAAQKRRSWADTVIQSGRLLRVQDEYDAVVMDIQICPVQDIQGEVTRLAIYARDITEQRQAEESLQQYTKRLQILNEIGRAILAAQSPEEIAQAAVNYLYQLIGCRRICVLSIDAETQEMTVLAVKCRGVSKIEIGLNFPAEESEGLEKLGYGEIHTVEDLQSCPQPDPPLRRLKELLQPEGVRAFISVPLMADGEHVGILNLGSSRPGIFAYEYLDIIGEVANQLAVAIQQARLHEAEQSARQMAETLRAANVALTRSLDLEVVLETLLEYLSQLVPYDSANVMLRETESRVAVRAIRGYEKLADPNAVRSFTIDVYADPSIRTVLDRQETVLIPDTHQHSDWIVYPISRHVRNWLGVPLVAGGIVIGLYSLDKVIPNLFTREHCRWAEALAAQAAVAIQNAQLFAQVDTARLRLQFLSQRLIETQEIERRHLARELHDEIGQSLTGLKFLLMADNLQSVESARDKLSRASSLVNDLMAQVRQLLLDLQPTVLDDLGLLPALLQQFDRYTAQTGIHVLFKHTGLKQRFASEIEITVYRLVQEALTNVARHAEVSEVTVLLWADQEVLIVQIEDQGAGFDLEAELSSGASSGLSGMQERVALVGGDLLIETSPGTGTRLTVKLPLFDPEKKGTGKDDDNNYSGR